MHYTTAAEAVKLIRSNDSVYIQGSTSIPEALVAAMEIGRASCRERV